MAQDNVFLMDCLLREVAPGDSQFVPLCEVPASTRHAGETVYRGAFRTQVENLGPYKSHARTICLQAGPLSERALSA